VDVCVGKRERAVLGAARQRSCACTVQEGDCMLQ